MYWKHETGFPSLLLFVFNYVFGLLAQRVSPNTAIHLKPEEPIELHTFLSNVAGVFEGQYKPVK